MDSDTQVIIDGVTAALDQATAAAAEAIRDPLGKGGPGGGGDGGDGGGGDDEDDESTEGGGGGGGGLGVIWESVALLRGHIALTKSVSNGLRLPMSHISKCTGQKRKTRPSTNDWTSTERRYGGGIGRCYVYLHF